MSISKGAKDKIVRLEEGHFNFDFKFSMPIQDTFTLTRDPNRFPIVDRISNGHISTPDLPPPNRLTTANLDVQNYIMAFLYTEDLSSLMRTCRYFLDACLPALCARSNELHFDRKLTRVPSFRRFLRINAGPSSRAHLVKELCIYASGALELQYIYEPDFISLREEWSAALLDILRHCHNMRCLRMYKWFLHDIPFPFLVKTISSSLPHLEELTMPVPYDTDAAVLRRLARLPLRSFSFLKYPPSQNIPDAYISVDVLPRSVTELDIHRSPRTDTPFPGVQKLGIRDTALSTFVVNATSAFPNVSHLVLRRQDMGFTRNVSYNKELLDDARMCNKTQWESSQYRKAWPAVSAIWTEDPTYLYILGFSRQVASISVPMGELVREDYISQVLADTSPSFLELRLHIDFFKYRRTDWESVFGPSTRRLTLLLYTRAPTDKDRVRYVLDCFGAMLPALPSLTHLLVRFMPTPQQPGSALETPRWVYSSATGTQIVHGTIQERLRGLAGTGASLRWIGYEVFDWGIKSWDISRPNNNNTGGLGSGVEDVARRVKSVKMAEVGESESMAVAKREGMNVFKDPVLADAAPSFLELRIDTDDFIYVRKDWGHIFGTSIQRLTLLQVLYTRGSSLDKHCVTYMLGCLAVMLPALPSLTYLVVSFAPMPRRLGFKLSMYWVSVPSTESEVMRGIIEKHLRSLAIRITSLRWIGYEVYGWGMKSWNISRSNGSRNGSGAGVDYVPARRLKMAEMDEYESMAVVKREGMDVFKDASSGSHT
ncbi:hypothetical protein GSI_10189 [Ganoderma sinense ZZ0214-1]|uniref:Uncharacterized protein n=1 Tax=Ganoderma sinense ZZ0214-1 TaxID=1077348 RepID=A0A2G8RZV4_9APHY|nr:hypothetical protein GSI_10189 [Ganoderma sinense ZZ0214-1]